VKILALDTATEACSVALWRYGKVVSDYRELERGHADVILPMIDALLREQRLTLGELDAIAFGRGPGGFTGVRLAASVTQGLAYAAKRPVIPVSNLLAIAAQVQRLPQSVGKVLVVNDARMREVYWCAYDIGSDTVPTQMLPERVGPASEIAPPAEWRGPWIAAGRGLTAYPDLAQRAVAAGAQLLERLLPHAEDIARVAAREFAAGRALPPTQALPVYVRDRVAEPQVTNLQ
jgi:tRNA threonylcarbamoyladenosine biosynthesis protein TsaB